MRILQGFLRLILLPLFVFLPGCDDPSVQVSSMGESVTSPSLLSSSPFSQDFNTQQYVQLTGACDSHVTSMQISVDDQNWFTIAAQPLITGTTLTSSAVNQTNCSGGAFNFYVTQADINSWLGTTGSSSNINTIYLRGITTLGPTATLTLNKTGSDSSPVATLVQLTKTSPAGYAGAGQCGYLYFSLTDAAGNNGVAASDVTVSLQSLIGTAISTVSAYNTWDDCDNSTNVQTSFTIPAGYNTLGIIYKFTTLEAVSGANDIVQLRPLTTSTLVTATTNYTSITLRDSSSTSTYRWLGFNSYSNIFRSNCYPLTLQRNYYGTSTQDTFIVNVAITSSTPQAVFYSDAACSQSTSNFVIQASSNTATVYVEYTPTSSQTNNLASFTYSMTASSPTNAAITYDIDVETFNVDLSNLSTPTALAIMGPNEITANICNSFTLQAVNANYTPLSSATPISVTLSTTLGTFYADSSCSTPITSTSIPVAAYGTNIYFQAPTTSTTETAVFSAAASGFTTGQLTTTLLPQ